MVIEFVRAKDFKRIKVAEVTTGGAHSVTIGGRNAQGKSSLLDAVALALLGRDAMPTAPVRAGAEKAEIEVGLSDGIRITRKFSPDGKGTVKITTADGMTRPSPQEWLDARLAKFTCDPVRFLAEKPADQAATLRKVAGIDTTILDQKRAEIYATRTDANRDAARAKAVADAMPLHADAPAAEVDVAALSAEIEAAARAEAKRAEAMAAITAARHAHGEQVRDARAGLARATDYIATTQREEDRLVAEIARLQVELGKTRANLATAKDAESKWTAKVASVEADTSAVTAAEEAAAAVVVPDVAPVRAAIASAGEQNRKLRENAERAKAKANAAALAEAADKLTSQIAEIDAQKVAMLAAATFPIPGLSVDDSGPTFNGVPLSQASQAEKIRVAMGIALAGNPTIRVVLIRDASLLDAESMAEIERIATERDAQVWLERVGDADDGAIIIEDGTVRGATEPDQTTLV